MAIEDQCATAAVRRRKLSRVKWEKTTRRPLALPSSQPFVYGNPLMSSNQFSSSDASSGAKPPADRLMKLNQVMTLVSLGKTLIYQLVSDGGFPKPLKVGSNANRWSENEIFSWIAERAAARSA